MVKVVNYLDCTFDDVISVFEQYASSIINGTCCVYDNECYDAVENEWYKAPYLRATMSCYDDDGNVFELGVVGREGYRSLESTKQLQDDICSVYGLRQEI